MTPGGEGRAGLRWLVADNPGPLTLDGTRVYQVGEEESVLLDPGPADPDHTGRLLEWLEAGPPVGAVCLTHAHPDHAGCAGGVARELGVEVAASDGTLERLGLEGRALGEGDELELGGAGSLVAVETPGHSSDHVAYLWLPERAVFTGDLVLGSGSAMVAHPDGDMGRYLASLRRLRALVPAGLYPGHGDPVDDAMGRLSEYLDHRREREEQIRKAVREGAGSVGEIRRRVYAELPDGLAPAAEASIRAHLEHLEAEGERLPPLRGREAVDHGLH